MFAAGKRFRRLRLSRIRHIRQDNRFNIYNVNGFAGYPFINFIKRFIESGIFIGKKSFFFYFGQKIFVPDSHNFKFLPFYKQFRS